MRVLLHLQLSYLSIAQGQLGRESVEHLVNSSHLVATDSEWKPQGLDIRGHHASLLRQPQDDVVRLFLDQPISSPEGEQHHAEQDRGDHDQPQNPHHATCLLRCVTMVPCRNESGDYPSWSVVPSSTLHLGRQTFTAADRVVMAIVNRTPDSFYDAGRTFSDDNAMAAVDAAVDAGAEIVDIGGVKAGPGDAVDLGEELHRTVDFVAAVRERHPLLIISVDTWRHEVGEAVCRAGADVLNDAWGGFDPELAHVAAHFDVGLVCTHAGGATPRTRPHRVEYQDVVATVLDFLTQEARRAEAAGVKADRIMIDPGHDFGKNTRHSLTLTRELGRLTATGRPVLVSLSNKDFVGETLDVPVGERLEGTLAATAVSSWLGARVFRVHEPRETRDVLSMVQAISGARQPAVARRGLA
jgi:dihydropteroate synthase